MSPPHNGDDDASEYDEADDMDGLDLGMQGLCEMATSIGRPWPILVPQQHVY